MEDGTLGPCTGHRVATEQVPREVGPMVLEKHLPSGYGSVMPSGICELDTGSSRFSRMSPGMESYRSHGPWARTHLLHQSAPSPVSPLFTHVPTFPVQPTPFQMQKYTSTQAMASVMASGQRICPGLSSPSVIWCMLRLGTEDRGKGHTGPAGGECPWL